MPRRGATLAETSGSGQGDAEASSLGSGLADLHSTRDLVVSEVRKAPKRRIDNQITRLVDAVHLLQMYATVSEAARKEYAALRWNTRAQTGGVIVAGTAAAAATFYLGLPMEVTSSVGGASVLGVGLSHWYSRKLLEGEERRIVSADGLNHLFEGLYSSQVGRGARRRDGGRSLSVVARSLSAGTFDRKSNCAADASLPFLFL